jgi:hypothetical protein
MKSLLLAVAFATNAAWASGNLMLEPRYNLKTEQVYLVAGLSTHAKLWGPFSYTSWSGLGDKANGSEYSNWYVTKHQLDIKVLGVKLSPGLRFGYSENMGSFKFDKIDTEVFGKLSIPLW